MAKQECVLSVVIVSQFQFAQKLEKVYQLPLSLYFETKDSLQSLPATKRAQLKKAGGT
jgi:hypothetical protein